MLKAVTVTNFKGESLRMELSKPEDTGLLIYNITGLGSPVTTINSTEMATVDGARFNSARAQTRNIVFTVAFEDANSILDDNGNYIHTTERIEVARHRSYKYFPSKKKLTLQFETDERTIAIEGYVESNDPTIFSSQEYSQISIICTDPYFRAVAPSEVVFKTVIPEGGFEFPFSNESLDERLITMGELKDDTVYDVVYKGDVDTGMIITIQATAQVRGLEIWNTDTREHMALDDEKIFQITGGYIDADDIITISTIKGHKYATLQRGVKVYNILNAMAKDSDWIQLTQGDNIIGYTAVNGIDFLAFKIEFYMLYEGV